MKPAVLLFVAAVLSLCYITTGHPHDEIDEEDDEGRRSFAIAHAHAEVKPFNPGANPFGPTLGSPGSPASPLAARLPSVSSQCYSCTDCPKVLTNTTVRPCGYNAPRCVVYSEKYNHLSKPVYIRGCVSERGSCDDIRRSHEGHQNVLKLLTCEDCYGDKCNTNGVPRSLPDFTTALFFIVVIPVIKKYTLS